jgi:nuclear transport factor 2 (NTF2) superfamily protein
MSMAPPFSAETAKAKVKKAQDLWNTRYAMQSRLTARERYLTIYRDPANVAKAYTEDSIWRNRSTFIKGHAQIVEFLTEKWEKEQSYRLRKELVGSCRRDLLLMIILRRTSCTVRFHRQQDCRAILV